MKSRRNDNGCFTCEGGMSPIAKQCPDPICETCLEQIRLAHSLGMSEKYSIDGKLIPRSHYAEDLRDLGIWAKTITVSPADGQFEWYFLLSEESRKGWSYARDQLHWNDAQLFFYERWAAVAEFLNHHARIDTWIETLSA